MVNLEFEFGCVSFLSLDFCFGYFLFYIDYRSSNNTVNENIVGLIFVSR